MATGNGILLAVTTQTASGVLTLTGLPSPQNVSTSLKCQGAFDATFQVFGTMATTTTLNVQYTLDPNFQADLAAGRANIFVNVTTLTASAVSVFTGHAYALRLNSVTTSSNDNYGVAWFWSDKR